MVTAYDAPSARLADAAGVDMVLVGDSAGTTVLGGDVHRAGDDGRDAAVFTRAVVARRAARARRGRHAVRFVSGLGGVGGRERDPAREGSGRRRREARRRGPHAHAHQRHRRRRHSGDGAHRPDAAVGDACSAATARRAARPRRRDAAGRRGAWRSSARAVSRSCSRRCPRSSPRASPARCTIPTIGIGAGAGVLRPGARLARPARAVAGATPALRQAVRRSWPTLIAAALDELRGATCAPARSPSRATPTACPTPSARSSRRTSRAICDLVIW